MLRGGLKNAACVRGEIAPLLPTLSLRLQRMVASSQAGKAAQCELSGANLEGTRAAVEVRRASTVYRAVQWRSRAKSRRQEPRICATNNITT